METSRSEGTPVSREDRTRGQFGGSNAATLTAGFEIDHPTAAWSEPVRMRPAPAGYDLFRYLGGGGMGDVFVAREHAAERVVAIKFLRPTSNPALRERFLKEVRALGRIEHPHVVRIISVDVDRSDPFYTMEYGPGGTLADRIKSEGPYGAEEAARIGIQLAGALAATHEADILHRDIKPSNVVLAADGTPKLSDFGLAKLMDTDDELTRTTQAIGTPAFMPPEQITRKLGDCGPATDVYGLGATLYAMITGKAPFEGDSNEDIISKVRSDDPVRPCKFRPELPMGLEAVVMKCLEKHPSRRYASADELAKDLEQCLKGKQSVPPLTRSRRAGKWLGRHRVRIGLVALAACLIAFAPALLNRPDAEDPVAEMNRELAAGRRVELIGNTGLPRWFERPIGGVEVGTSIASQGACTVSSVGQGFVVLHPSLDIDRYELEGEFQETGFVGGHPNANPEQWYGLVAGYHIQQLPATERLHSFAGVTFRDFDRGLRLEMARLGVSVVSEQPGRNPEHVLGGSGPFIRYTPSPSLPGTWRKVKYVLEPERIQAFWRLAPVQGETEGKLERFADWKASDHATRAASTERTMRSNIPPINGSIPEWTPKRGVALWSVRAAFAVRNVFVTPLPPQP